MTTHKKEKIITTLAAFPVMWLMLLYFFIVRARFHFGHWPSAADGMAKYMGFAFHHSLAVYTMLASPFVALIVIVSAIVFRRKDSRFRIGLPIAILAASALLCMAVIAADPGRFIFWFTD